MTTMYKVALDAIETQVETEGSFSALVAVFGEPADRQGDVIHRGAFAASLARWRASGQKIPVCWSHAVGDPNLVIGSCDPAKCHETDAGLVVAGKLNVYTSTVASHVRDLLRNGDVSGWSFSFAIEDARPRRGGGKDLLVLDLGEVGPCVMPANPATRTISVKNEEPERREPRRPSHTELETRLRAAGILARVVPDLEEEELDTLHGIYGRRRNGGDDHKATMSALLNQAWDTGREAKATSPAPVTIATFGIA
jgi:HK97 family phage prohead protease